MRSRIADRLRGKPDGGGGSEPQPDPRPEPWPAYEPFPGAGFFQIGRRDPLITAMGERLVAEGCGRYEEGPSPDWTDADRKGQLGQAEGADVATVGGARSARRQAGRRSPGQSRSVHPRKLNRT